MLKYKIRKGNAISENKELEIVEPILESGSTLYIVAENASLKEGEEVTFTRIEKDDINFYETRKINTVDKESGQTLFTVDSFDYINLKVDGISEEYIFDTPLKKAKNRYFTFLFSDENKHYLFENRNILIKEVLQGDYSTETEDNSIRRCKGDYVLFNKYFLYSAETVDDNIYSAFSEEFLNKKDGIIIVIPNQDIKDFLGDKITGKNWKYDKEKNELYLINCITPILNIGKDNRCIILWNTGEDSKELGQKIQKNLPYLNLYTKDERFITESGKTSENALFYKMANNAAILQKKYSLIISNALQEDFSTNLIQEELLTENYIDEVKEKKKNKIIDYEKQTFEPVFYDESGNVVSYVTEINYTLNFRDRSGSTDWKTDDDKYWNNYTEKDNKLTGTSRNFMYSDLLGYLDFTDEDVYYRKKRLSKSFLRLSFYNTKDRASQKLLFTSTIFMNDAKLFSIYMKKFKNGVEKGTGYVFDDSSTDRLDASFACKGKFFNEISNNYNDNASSEGFYLYLFPTILDDYYEGEIYMRAEFNHAKYGYTIPFILPVDEEGNIIQPTGSTEFPIDYLKKDNKDGTYTGDTYYADMKRLFNDMYITILLKYDSINNRYTWGIKNAANENNVMKLRLFEPKINRTDSKNE